MKKRYYIAYGSNLNVRQMMVRCPNARFAGTSTIPNYVLLFRGSMTGAYLTIEPKDGGSVPVAIWSVNAQDELALDRYEGYPHFYYKKEMVLPIKGIRSGKVRNRTAFAYIMHEDRPLGVPSNRYILTCMEGYEDFGFDLAPLMNACINSREEAQK